MEEIKHVQFLDPLISSKENKSKAMFLPPGRYHGYDQILTGVRTIADKYSVSIFHGIGTYWGAIKVTGTSNTAIDTGFLVSPHGVIISSFIDDQETGVNLDIPVSLDGDKYYMVVASLIWADSNPGNQVLFALVEWEPSDPLNIDISEWTPSGATDWAIGYFKVEEGAKDYNLLTYLPHPTPNFAIKGGIPATFLPKLARRDEDNTFEGFNAFDSTTSFSYNPATKTLSLAGKSIGRISYSNITEIRSISWNAPENSVLYLFMDQVTPSSFVTGGNLILRRNLPIREGSAFILMKVQGSFVILSATDSLLEVVSSLPLPPVPAYGDWLSWNPASAPSVFEVGGQNTFRFWYRRDSANGVVIRVAFTLNTAISNAVSHTLSSQETPFPGIITEASINFPVVGVLVGPVSGVTVTPYFKVTESTVVVVFPGACPGGSYTSPETYVSSL